MTKREKLLAGAASAALLITLWANWGPGGEEKGNASMGEDAKRGASSTTKTPLSLVPLRMDDLKKQKPKYERAERNPFYFGAQTATVVETAREQQIAALKRTAEEEHVRLVEVERQRVEAMRASPPPAARPSLPFAFMGYVGEPDDEVAIFRDGREYLLAKRGETLHQQYEVVDIGYESVEIRFPGSQQTYRYPLETAPRPSRR